MLRRPGSIKLMDVFGIRIGVDRGWFLILFLVILWLSPSFRSALDSSDGVAYLTTVISALLFFGSLIVHELGPRDRRAAGRGSRSEEHPPVPVRRADRR